MRKSYLYIEPSFTDISPPPYELIPDIEGKVVKAELLDGLLLVVLEDRTFQIIDFDSLEALGKFRLNQGKAAPSSIDFIVIYDVLLVMRQAGESLYIAALTLP